MIFLSLRIMPTLNGKMENEFSDNNTFFKSESSDTDEEAIGPKGKIRRRSPTEKLNYHTSMEEFTASLSVST